jgi:CO/xanthine dehydrogenase FAD-binding subunit
VNYTSAHSLDEALAALAAGARPVAGGSDLVVAARCIERDSVLPVMRIDLNRRAPHANVLKRNAIHGTCNINRCQAWIPD